MNTVTLETKERKNKGTKEAKIERNAGQIPCVLYGGKENAHFTINSIEFDKLVNTPEVNFIELKQAKKTFKAVIKAVQFHPVTDNVLHVDFQEMIDNKPVTMRIPVRLSGSAIGEMNGGKLLQKLRRMAVESMPDALPAEIVVDVTNMGIGDAIKVGDIEAGKGLTFLEPDNAVVCLVKVLRGIVEEVVEDTEDEEGDETTEGEEGESEGKADDSDKQKEEKS